VNVSEKYLVNIHDNHEQFWIIRVDAHGTPFAGASASRRGALDALARPVAADALDRTH